jgi:hypothetical protein
MQACPGDKWDKSGPVEEWKLLERTGSNACGFVAVYDNTPENNAILTKSYMAHVYASDVILAVFIFLSVSLLLLAIDSQKSKML